jgi:phage tail protein X
VRRVVRPGESLSQLVNEAYGRVDARIIAAVLAHNPGVADADRILAGDVIVLPPAAVLEARSAPSP